MRERKPHYGLSHRQGQDLRVVLGKMPDLEHFVAIADQFSMLSDPTRLRIFWMLCHCCECVSTLSDMSGMSAAAVSHHLQMLRRAHLVVCHRHGKEIHYTLAETQEAELLHRAVDTLFALSCPFEPPMAERRT